MEIASKIKQRINNVNGDIGFYFYDIEKDQGCFVGNCDIFPSLGVSKFILLIEIYRQVEENIISFDDEYVLEKKPPFAIPENEYEATVGILDFLHEGIVLTIRDLVYSMMVISDNSAFNILLSIVGMENVNNTMEKLGMAHTKIQCMLFEWDDVGVEKHNYHSTREVGDLMKRLYKRQLISNAASEEMLRLMSFHQRRNILSYFSNRNVTVMQQTGFDIDILHDIAIVMEEKPFILCMCTNHIDAKKAEQMMKDVALMCYHSILE